MVDVMTSARRSALMSRIRGKDTNPELKLRHAAWTMGLRYRVNYRIGRIRPDMTFPGARMAVFVDGCFWHCCPLHCVMPKSNVAFWKPKLERNVERDREANDKLRSAGWQVLRFWEHEVEASPEACAQRIAEAVSAHIATRGRRVR